jgi:threonine synthase
MDIVCVITGHSAKGQRRDREIFQQILPEEAHFVPNPDGALH